MGCGLTNNKRNYQRYKSQQIIFSNMANEKDEHLKNNQNTAGGSDSNTKNLNKICKKKVKKENIYNNKMNEINIKGFFCKIPFLNKSYLPVLITNYIIFKMDKNELEEFTLNIVCFSGNLIKKNSLNNKITLKIKINDTRKIYTNKKLNIAIIEIIDIDNINKNLFLKLDERILEQNTNNLYKDKEAYFLNEKQEDIKCKISCINENKYIELFYKNKSDFSGNPIFLKNNNIIGIFIGMDQTNTKNKNILGLFIKEPIIEFNDKYNNISVIKIKYKHIKNIPSKNLKQLRNIILKRRLFNEKFV